MPVTDYPTLSSPVLPTQQEPEPVPEPGQTEPMEGIQAGPSVLPQTPQSANATHLKEQILHLVQAHSGAASDQAIVATGRA